MIEAREHDYEPIPGLPGNLPDGERVLWQGRPDAACLAKRAFATRWVAGYFGLLALWTVASGLHDGRPFGALAFSAAIPIMLAAAVMALAELYAWGVERTTLYTITNRRIVMRIGVALSMTFNLPFRQIETADLRVFNGGSGTIALTLKDDQRISWLRLWPHSRPWRLARPQPALRCIPEAETVAALLAKQLAKAAEISVVRTTDALHSSLGEARLA